MVRAPSGQTPRERSIMPRNTNTRKFHPSLDQFESKQLLSGGLLTQGAQAIVQPPAPVSSHAQHLVASPDGTGKGIVIITP
jgi:hypothetical protein